MLQLILSIVLAVPNIGLTKYPNGPDEALFVVPISVLTTDNRQSAVVVFGEEQTVIGAQGMHVPLTTPNVSVYMSRVAYAAPYTNATTQSYVRFTDTRGPDSQHVCLIGNDIRRGSPQHVKVGPSIAHARCTNLLACAFVANSNTTFGVRYPSTTNTARAANSSITVGPTHFDLKSATRMLMLDVDVQLSIFFILANKLAICSDGTTHSLHALQDDVSEVSELFSICVMLAAIVIWVKTATHMNDVCTTENAEQSLIDLVGGKGNSHMHVVLIDFSSTAASIILIKRFTTTQLTFPGFIAPYQDHLDTAAVSCVVHFAVIACICTWKCHTFAVPANTRDSTLRAKLSRHTQRMLGRATGCDAILARIGYETCVCLTVLAHIPDVMGENFFVVVHVTTAVVLLYATGRDTHAVIRGSSGIWKLYTRIVFFFVMLFLWAVVIAVGIFPTIKHSNAFYTTNSVCIAVALTSGISVILCGCIQSETWKITH